MQRPSARTLSYVAIFLLVVLASWGVREASHLRLEFAENSSQAGDWYSVDSDGLYHLRRIERYRAEPGLPAATDPYLNFPKGAVVPWPPYYTMVASALTSSSGTRLDLEHAASELPLSFAMLTTLLAAFCGAILAGPRGALLAGLLHALSYGSVHYSTPGVADHHAWVSLLATALLVLFALAVQQQIFLRPRFASFVGALAGTIAGVLLGSWVGAVLYILPLQLALGWWLCVQRDDRWLGLATFGLFFHLLAIATLGPAVLSSPWRVEHPWMVVNLSYFHLVWLGLGALVFVPPLFMPFHKARARYPWMVLAVGGVLAAATMLFGVGPGPGIREGFAWASRADAFMSGIAESAPLWGVDHYHSGGFMRWIGLGVVLLPFALWVGWKSIQKGNLALVPIFVAAPLLAVQAFAQRRFADPLAAPLAILIAWWLVHMWARLRLPQRNVAVSLLLAALLAIGLQAPTVLYAFQRAGVSRIDDQKSAERSLFEWLGAREDLPLGEAARPEGLDPNLNPVAPGGENALDTKQAVMAAWDFGHVIEWAAQRPTIATNFGTYIGEDSFRDPAIFFMSEDPQTAEEMLIERDVRYVVTTARFPSLLGALVKALDDGRKLSDYQTVVGEGQRGVKLLPRWYGTTGAMLFDIGNDMDGPDGPAQAIDYMRLIYMSELVVAVGPQLGGGQRAGRIWERVPGAQLVSNVGVGKELQVQVHFETRNRHNEPLFQGTWLNRAVADETGFARVRLPYHSGLNGSVWVVSILWGTDDQLQPLQVPEQAVLVGDSIVKIQ
jgi:asparagine N-glycosylation enzyme membrane subunit Stt3